MTTKPEDDMFERVIQDGYWLGQFEKMRKERDTLRAALVLMVETFGPISDISAAGASQPVIEQAREALGR